MTVGDGAFTPDGLQTGASMALTAAETAQLGGSSVSRADCSGASFGLVQGAEQLAAALRAAVGQDPDQELARLTSAAPQQISTAAQAFRTGGEYLDTAWDESLSAQEQIGASHQADGDPVCDRAVHLAALPPEFSDASNRMLDVAGRLRVVGEALAEQTHLAQQQVQRLHDELRAAEQTWIEQCGPRARCPSARGVSGWPGDNRRSTP